MRASMRASLSVSVRASMRSFRALSGAVMVAGVAAATPCRADDGAAAPPPLPAVRVVGDESGTAGKVLTIIAGTGADGAGGTENADGAPKRIRIRVVGDVATVIDAAEFGAAEAGAAAGGGAEAGGVPARKLVPYIGVATSPLAPAVRAQTGLPEDVGLAVDAVTPDSPAAAAGLVPFDVLAKYDDQILCAAVQLSALVKRTGTGNTATLTVLRGGKELTVPVKVGQREADVTMQIVPGPGMPGFGGGGFGVGAGMAPMGIVPGYGLDQAALQRLQEAAKNAGGVWQGQVQGVVPLPGGAPWTAPLPGVPMPPPRFFFITPGGQPDGGTAGGVGESGGAGPGAGAATQTQSQSIAMFTDAEGRVEFRDTNGTKRVIVFGADGQEQYSGAYDTDADRAAVPEALRARVGRAAGSIGQADPRPQPLELKKMSL